MKSLLPLTALVLLLLPSPSQAEGCTEIVPLAPMLGDEDADLYLLPDGQIGIAMAAAGPCRVVRQNPTDPGNPCEDNGCQATQGVCGWDIGDNGKPNKSSCRCVKLPAPVGE